MTTAAYDLVLTGGNLLDPAQGINNERRDVAFKDGKVAAVANSISPDQGSQSIDVSGKLITPGLIDLHGHFYHGASSTAVHADQTCLSSGTTTGVDAGSSGFLNYGAMRDYCVPGAPHPPPRLPAHRRRGPVGQPRPGRRSPRHANHRRG